VRERLAELDCDPVAELVLIARDPSTSPELKSRILLGILDYASPKLRAVAVAPAEPDALPFQIEIVSVASPNADPEPAPQMPLDGLPCASTCVIGCPSVHR
jgi:hypothetical protein